MTYTHILAYIYRQEELKAVTLLRLIKNVLSPVLAAIVLSCADMIATDMPVYTQEKKYAHILPKNCFISRSDTIVSVPAPH